MPALGFKSEIVNPPGAPPISRYGSWVSPGRWSAPPTSEQSQQYGQTLTNYGYPGASQVSGASQQQPRPFNTETGQFWNFQSMLPKWLQGRQSQFYQGGKLPVYQRDNYVSPNTYFRK